MNAQGWTLMLIAVTATTGTLAWCLWKILTEPTQAEHLHSQSDIQPNDRE